MEQGNGAGSPPVHRSVVRHALGEAVAAIYFADSSDYLSALWTIVRDLGGQEAADLLESDERKAFEQYAKGRDG